MGVEPPLVKGVGTKRLGKGRVKNFKLDGILGLCFKVSKMLKLIKPLLFGNHDNHSIIKYFLPITEKI